ncbi:MAG: hypothetical protein WBG17_03615 [Burkholderiaceae bacterium]
MTPIPDLKRARTIASRLAAVACALVAATALAGPSSDRSGASQWPQSASASNSAKTTSRTLIAPSGIAVDLPEPASLSNLGVRQWYLDQAARIPQLVDSTATLEQQARQAVDLRNAFRSAARDAMLDQETADMLRATNPNLTWDQVVQKYSADHSGDDLWQRIIGAAQRTRTSVNRSLGSAPPKEP